MVTSDGNVPAASTRPHAENAYEFNARNALALYGPFVDGVPNNTLMAVSATALPKEAKAALEASAAKLGYGKDAWAWVCIEAPAEGSQGGEGSKDDAPATPEEGALPGEEPLRLGAGDLRAIVECMDPISVVATDSKATAMLSKAYAASMKVDSANRVACRTVVAFRDFSAMLLDDDDKQKAWYALKSMKL